MNTKKLLSLNLFITAIICCLLISPACSNKKTDNLTPNFNFGGQQEEAEIKAVSNINCDTENGKLKYIRLEKAASGVTDTENAYLFIFEFTNKQKNPKHVYDIYNICFFQNGVQLREVASWHEINEQALLVSASTTQQVLKDGTLPFACMLAPKDNSPITITVKGDGEYQMMEVNLS